MGRREGKQGGYADVAYIGNRFQIPDQLTTNTFLKTIPEITCDGDLYMKAKQTSGFVVGSDSHVSIIVLLFLIACENVLQVGWLSV